MTNTSRINAKTCAFVLLNEPGIEKYGSLDLDDGEYQGNFVNKVNSEK